MKTREIEPKRKHTTEKKYWSVEQEEEEDIRETSVEKRCHGEYFSKGTLWTRV